MLYFLKHLTRNILVYITNIFNARFQYLPTTWKTVKTIEKTIIDLFTYKALLENTTGDY